MFKNRVRTAALAGAIAVATGVSGLSVPAYADPITGDHFNQPDASQQGEGTVATNVPGSKVDPKTAVQQLNEALTATEKQIANFPIKDYRPLNNRPIEKNAFEDASAKANKATELLAQASQNLDNVNATIDSVQAETNAANAAWAKYADAVSISRAEYIALQELENDLDLDNEFGHGPKGTFYYTGKLTPVDKKAGQDGYLSEVAASRISIEGPNGEGGLAKELNEELGKLDPSKKVDVDRINKLTTYQKKLTGYLNGWNKRDELYADALEKTNIATSRNLAELRELQRTASAQVRALRVIQAFYLVEARWLNLYESNENGVINFSDGTNGTRTTTLRAEYERLLGAGNENTNTDDAVLLSRARDAKNNIGKAKGDQADIYFNLRWENPVTTVRLLDKGHQDDAAARAAAAAADKAEKEAQKKTIDELTQAIKDLNQKKSDVQAPSNNGSTNNNQGDTTQDPKKDDQGLKIFGIIAGVIAAIAALAGLANLPQVKAMLNI